MRGLKTPSDPASPEAAEMLRKPQESTIWWMAIACSRPTRSGGNEGEADEWSTESAGRLSIRRTNGRGCARPVIAEYSAALTWAVEPEGSHIVSASRCTFITKKPPTVNKANNVVMATVDQGRRATKLAQIRKREDCHCVKAADADVHDGSLACSL